MLPGIRWLLAAGMALAGLSTVAASRSGLAQPARMSIPPAPPTSAAGTADPVAGLVGRGFTFCGWAGVPFDAVVERADWSAGPGGNMRAVLVVQVTYSGSGATGAYITVQLRDERGRVFDFARAGSGVDVVDLAREYGVLTPTMPVQAGRPARHVWAFVVAPDVEMLTLVQDPLYRC